MRQQLQQQLEPYIERLKGLPFVRGLKVHRHPNPEVDGEIKIRPPEGTYVLMYELEHTYLGKPLTNATIAFAKALKQKHGLDTIVLAPYIPRPTGERLADAGLNFIDQHGNIYIDLGGRYQALVLGKVRADRRIEKTRTGPAAVQVLFAYLADPKATNWPVRRIADIAGVGKTIVADVRRRLVREGILETLPRKRYRIADQKQLEQRWLVGYGELLRPRLLVGTFRGPHRDPEVFVREFARRWRADHGNWALTGGAAAYVLQRFYRGNRTQIFAGAPPMDLQRTMRLVKDVHGPIALLRPFTPLVFWKTVGTLRVAHPWLVYAELLLDAEPRALEAAEKLYDEFLRLR